VTFYPGTPNAKMHTGAALVGFRPGYSYRIAINGIPNQPDTVLYPEIEVRGSLVPRDGLKYMEYPAAIVFSADDLNRAAQGSFITKVIYLEDPDRAAPVQTTADKPIETMALSTEEAIHNALDLGRLVMIVRLGNRVPDQEVLHASAIPGTMLLPGETRLTSPSAPPRLPFGGIPLYDPILGPKYPGEECLTDGGDKATRLGVTGDGKLLGLNPTDVAVEFTQQGKRRVTTSNQICICVPRFAVQRVEVGPGGLHLNTRAESDVQAYGLDGMHTRIRAQGLLTRIKPAGYQHSLKLRAEVGSEGPHILVAPWTKPRAVGVTQGLQIVASAVAPDETTNFDGFIVTKSADPDKGVKIGDVVTITIRYVNRTGQPVSEIVISDDLTPRLEYVPGSSESDRPATFTTEINEVGSSIVQFDIPGTLQPGQGGLVRFKVRVR
jgi:uncharacterized repeat protein (TIGR01451 family)